MSSSLDRKIKAIRKFRRKFRPSIREYISVFDNLYVVYLFIFNYIHIRAMPSRFIKSAVVYFETETIDKAKKSCIQF
jgi:hypothetical protein